MWSFTCFRRPRKKDQLSSGKSAVLSSCVPYLSFLTVLYQFPTVLNILYSLLTKVFSLIYDSTSRFPSWSRQSSFQIHSYIWALKLVFLKKKGSSPKMQHILYTFFKNCFVKQYQLHILKCKSEQNLDFRWDRWAAWTRKSGAPIC